MHTHARLPLAILQHLLSFDVKSLLCSYHTPRSGVLTTPLLTHARRATRMGSVASSYEGQPHNTAAQHTACLLSFFLSFFLSFLLFFNIFIGV